MKELLVAAELGNIERMNCIFKATEQWEMTHQWLTQGDIKGRTILHFAAIYGYMGVATCILDKITAITEDEILQKQYINIQDCKGRTPLFHAVAEGRIEVTQLMLERGADLEISTNHKHRQPGSTPLMACCEKNSLECLSILLDYGASLMHVREDGADATYIAARYGHLDAIERISECTEMETVINRPTFRGRTALITATFHGHTLVIRKLFKCGASLDHQDEYKMNALMYATREGYYDIVKWLVVNGANTRKRDLEGKNAMKIAESKGHVVIEKYLKQFLIDEQADAATSTVPKKQKRVNGRISYHSNKISEAKVL